LAVNSAEATLLASKEATAVAKTIDFFIKQDSKLNKKVSVL
jgi:hypothetical protein